MTINKLNQVDYLGDIKASYSLIEQIKRFYYHRGVSLSGAKFEIISEIDKFGSKFYSVRSNLVWDVKGQQLIIDKSRRGLFDFE